MNNLIVSGGKNAQNASGSEMGGESAGMVSGGSGMGGASGARGAGESGVKMTGENKAQIMRESSGMVSGDGEMGMASESGGMVAGENKAHKEIPGNPSVATSSRHRLSTRANGEKLRVLSEEDWAFWIENGYVVVKQAVPREQAQRLADYLWEYEGKDAKDPETWYRPTLSMKMAELNNTGMVEIYNHQYLWDNRQYPRVYQAFADIWGMEELWVTIDRANLNFPIRPGHEYKGFIHWDYDPETKLQNVQGVLALADQTDENMGGFQCIPELFRTYDTWKLTQPDDRDHFKPDTTGFTPTKVKMEAGDLLIFNSSQPHGIRANNSKDKVRIAQYISMMPADQDNEEMRQWRVRSYKEKMVPEGYAFPGDPLHREKTQPVAVLSELGEKLLGLRKW